MERDKNQLVGIGYTTSIIVPVVGFVLGIILATKAGRTARHGVAVMLLAVVASGVWAGYLIHRAQAVAAGPPAPTFVCVRWPAGNTQCDVKSWSWPSGVLIVPGTRVVPEP